MPPAETLLSVYDGPLGVVAAGILGALLGSFLNVCVYRLPRDESIVTPRSRCPRCGKGIAWYDNVPILSWLALRARCRHCGEPISVQYPLVELAVALIWAGSVAWQGVSLDALIAAVFATLLLGIALTDAQFYVIPDAFSLGGMAVGLLFALLPGGLAWWAAVVGAALGYGIMAAVKFAGDYAYRRGWIGGAPAAAAEGAPDGGGRPLAIPIVAAVSMLAGGAVSAGFVFGATCGAGRTLPLLAAGLGGALALGALATFGIAAFERGEILVEKVTDLYQPDEQVEAMGSGDLRLMAMVGAFLGPLGVLATLFLGAAVGILAFVPFALRRRSPPIPFGIFLAIGAVAALLGAHGLYACYANWLAGQ